MFSFPNINSKSDEENINFEIPRENRTKLNEPHRSGTNKPYRSGTNKPSKLKSNSNNQNGNIGLLQQKLFSSNPTQIIMSVKNMAYLRWSPPILHSGAKNNNTINRSDERSYQIKLNDENDNLMTINSLILPLILTLLVYLISNSQ